MLSLNFLSFHSFLPICILKSQPSLQLLIAARQEWEGEFCSAFWHSVGSVLQWRLYWWYWLHLHLDVKISLKDRCLQCLVLLPWGRKVSRSSQIWLYLRVYCNQTSSLSHLQSNLQNLGKFSPREMSRPIAKQLFVFQNTLVARSFPYMEHTTVMTPSLYTELVGGFQLFCFVLFCLVLLKENGTRYFESTGVYSRRNPSRTSETSTPTSQ